LEDKFLVHIVAAGVAYFRTDLWVPRWWAPVPRATRRGGRTMIWSDEFGNRTGPKSVVQLILSVDPVSYAFRQQHRRAPGRVQPFETVSRIVSRVMPAARNRLASTGAWSERIANDPGSVQQK
jgi:hypothetical protein